VNSRRDRRLEVDSAPKTNMHVTGSGIFARFPQLSLRRILSVQCESRRAGMDLANFYPRSLLLSQ
jgi:hypothetical protein